ncbi:hypothetical protein C7M62_37185 [Bradyrhizobium sp. WBAH10]|nr:hypothetical protein [Bradyrhizobium sp. WBAH10]
MRGTLRESNCHRPCGDSPSPQPSPRKRGEGAHRPRSQSGHSRIARSRSALPTTLTEDSAIAAAAMIGESNRPNAG